MTPSAPEWLREKFPGQDREAFEVLRANFTERRGVFCRKDPNYIPTAREEEALDYMFHEWDYCYHEK